MTSSSAYLVSLLRATFRPHAFPDHDVATIIQPIRIGQPDVYAFQLAAAQTPSTPSVSHLGDHLVSEHVDALLTLLQLVGDATVSEVIYPGGAKLVS